MIAIDTNVLLRYLLHDDPDQGKKATAILSMQCALLTDVVLTETVWTLTGKKYGASKETVCRVIRALLGDKTFEFEDIQVIWTALRAYEDAVVVRGKPLDFADLLIVAKARHVLRDRGESDPLLFSLDKGVHQLAGASDL